MNMNERTMIQALVLITYLAIPSSGFSQGVRVRLNSKPFVRTTRSPTSRYTVTQTETQTARGYRSSSSINTDDKPDLSPEERTLDSAPLLVDPLSVEGSFYEEIDQVFKHAPITVDDPALVEFAPSKDFRLDLVDLDDLDLTNSPFPMAAMMQTSAQYIAAHAGEIAVFHISGDLLEQESADNIISDLALAWLLGMKLVLVVGCRQDLATCNIENGGADAEHPHECHNMLRVTDADTLRAAEEEAGYLRTEVERKLNRCLRPCIGSSSEDSPAPEGNVVSGNFYSAQRFGVVKGQDFEFTGCVSQVHSENIEQVLNNNDVVLLTTVGYSSLGELVNVNGFHLAASVAASLKAYKLVYMTNEGSVLRKKGEDKPLQELPLSFAKSITDYHSVKVHNTGFATFELARQELEPCATELLLHLGWASWALENGVQRAHIVNPGDGALLEELFTSQNGVSTCLYHDDEKAETDQDVAPEDWNDFFASAAEQGQDLASFN
jgi:acetylglutamate kinase